MRDLSLLYKHDADFAPLRIAGVDEAGRGPLAGPVVAAAVIISLSAPIEGVDDSKRLTAKRRDDLYDKITASTAWGVGISEPAEIDKVNILQATYLAMRRAVDNIGTEGAYDLLLVDGNQYIPALPRDRQRAIVGGDGKSASIAAASIVAKVTRDRLMEGYSLEYPQYGFAGHKGYGTRQHREAILRHGLCAIHRKSFCRGFIATSAQEGLFGG